MRITQVKPKYAVGRLLELTAKSKYRAEPFCPVFGECGGCQVQHFAYPAQLAWKREVVRNALKRIGGFEDAHVRDPIGMVSPRNYRNKMSLVVDHGGPQPKVGFYKQRSHEVVPIDACPIVDPQLSEIIGRLGELATQRDLAPAFADTRHIVARTARTSGQTVLALTTRVESAAVKAAAPALDANLPAVAGITNSYDISGENVILGRKNKVLDGRSYTEETIHDVRYRVSAASFFQVNTEIIARILSFLENGLREPRRIVDLYSGVGTFALFFAKHGSRVFGIEENRSAVSEAKENAGLNGLGERVLFAAGKVEELVSRPDVREELRQAEIVFLDPPRKGSDEATLGAVADAKVKHLWYLSCDPATLARDLKFLAAKGYRLGVVQPFDMFPQTGHVETLVTLYREGGVDTDLEEEQAEDPFADLPIPEWPLAERFASQEPEYPEFVIRE